MTDETKQLFDAPYTVKPDSCGVFDSEGTEIAWASESWDRNRIARIPELYDALDKASPYCPMWLTNEIVPLLQKVRDGE